MNLQTLTIVVSSSVAIGVLVVMFQMILHKLDRMETKIEADMRAMENRLNTRMDRLENLIRDILIEIGIIKHRLDRIEHRLDTIEGKLKLSIRKGV